MTERAEFTFTVKEVVSGTQAALEASVPARSKVKRAKKR